MAYPPESFSNNCMHIPFWDHFAPTLSQMKVIDYDDDDDDDDADDADDDNNND